MRAWPVPKYTCKYSDLVYKYMNCILIKKKHLHNQICIFKFGTFVAFGHDMYAQTYNSYNMYIIYIILDSEKEKNALKSFLKISLSRLLIPDKCPLAQYRNIPVNIANLNGMSIILCPMFLLYGQELETHFI